jgi:hypothetical protein
MVSNEATFSFRLEQALRYFSVLSKGDIIEVSFSMLTFEFLIVEITPEGPGINIIDTDLEVNLILILKAFRQLT